MAQVNAKKCDICGYVYEEYAEDTLMINIDGEEFHDLCKRCNSKLRDAYDYLTAPREKKLGRKVGYDIS